MYGEGISKYGELVDLAVKLDIIQKSGSWFSMGEERIGQGKDAAKQYLRDNPEICERVEAEIRQKKTRLLRPLQEKLELLEEEIARLETEKTEITSQLERPEVAADTEAVMELTSRFQQTDRQLETCFTQWADLSEKIEETEARIQEEAERSVSGS